MAMMVWLLSLFIFSISVSDGANVTYDHRSLLIDGHRKLIISAAIHYPRSVPGMWPGLVQTAKDGGVDAIETYVFWNGHEPSPGQYYFGGRYDLLKFAKIVQNAGLYLILRIGPFVAAEWNFGGVPVWLHYVNGTVFRTDNKPFKYHMQKFTTYIVNMMKQEKLFASQGGPIILAQIENEYGFYQGAYGEKGTSYAMWAAKMAVSQNIGVPWIMCQQNDAPDPVINTCNSFYCDSFVPNSPNKPKMWTENWPGWFKTFGARDPHRPAEDVAFSVARFFQKGGSLQNYYMYHGGTNFGRTSGGPFITTSYDYDAPIDEYGLARLPKWGHLKELHSAIKLCEHVVVNGDSASISLGPLQEADIYTDSLGSCAAFISNADDKKDKLVKFRNTTYHLPAWSVSILPDCKNVIHNTAKVQSQTSIVQMVPENLHILSNSKPEAPQWEVFIEKTGIWGEADFVKRGFVDHINTTKDTTDYLWYTTSLNISKNEEFLKKGSQPMMLVESAGHAVHVFVNHELQASGSGNGSKSSFKLKFPISLKEGENKIALLSMTVGLQNAGAYYEWVGAGPTSVIIESLGHGPLNLSTNAWTYKIGLQGESLGIYKAGGSYNSNWMVVSETPKHQPLTWYKALVDAPYGQEPVGLDMLHMGKGLAWLNGEEIGRYWPIKSSRHSACVKECDYRGKFFPDKCFTGCGEPTQRWYHVPRSWFKPSGNVLVIFEEKGGDPTKIKFSRRKITGVCAMVSESYSLSQLKEGQGEKDHTNNSIETVHLRCPENMRISDVKFASFGTPTGTCGSYQIGECHDPLSLSVVAKICLQKNECVIELTRQNFGKTTCSSSPRKLAVEVSCADK
uniref:Beta-galactosidase n=1 Tax=Kalanchoe fedtschenkoi TaxID=63787 RepID=A0A7N0U170_KALFE